MTNEQKQVASGMAAAVLFTAAVAVACGAVGWRPWNLGTDIADRLLYGAGCLLPPTATLAAAIGRVAAHRFTTPEDIAGAAFAPGTAELRILSAILQNTLEQLVLAAPVYLAAGLLLPAAWLGTVAAASALFVGGRIGFTRNYHSGAAKRAFGFALTFYPTVGLLLACFIAFAART